MNFEGALLIIVILFVKQTPSRGFLVSGVSRFILSTVGRLRYRLRQSRLAFEIDVRIVDLLWNNLASSQYLCYVSVAFYVVTSRATLLDGWVNDRKCCFVS